jgi:membrane fusion protein (multidrug efflux system)
MSAPFSRTLRSLQADEPRHRLVKLLVPILGGWIAWLFLARVPVYEVADRARLEVKRSAHALASPIPGRVVRSHLQLGRQVEEGEVLVELDARDFELAREEKEARLAALQDRWAALEHEARSERDTLGAQQQARTLGVQEAQAQVARAQAQARLADGEVIRAGRLHATRAISLADFQRAQAEAQTARAALQAATLAVRRLEQDRLAQEKECQTRIARLDREAVELRGAIRIEQAAARRLVHDIEQRRLRAPVSGRLGEVGEIPAGTVVQPAQKLGAIVPAGEPRAVALFPTVALGRLRPGQPARLRLAGFPWTQYGTVPAQVADVATEPIDGLVRVELPLRPRPTSTVPLEHGLIGSVEVEVERVSPAVLVLRAAGQLLGTRRFPPSSAEPGGP